MNLYATKTRGGRIELWETPTPPDLVRGDWKDPRGLKSPKRFWPPVATLPYDLFVKLYGELDRETFMRLA